MKRGNLLYNYVVDPVKITGLRRHIRPRFFAPPIRSYVCFIAVYLFSKTATILIAHLQKLYNVDLRVWNV